MSLCSPSNKASLKGWNNFTGLSRKKKHQLHFFLLLFLLCPGLVLFFFLISPPLTAKLSGSETGCTSILGIRLTPKEAGVFCSPFMFYTNTNNNHIIQQKMKRYVHSTRCFRPLLPKSCAPFYNTFSPFHLVILYCQM